MFRYLRCGLSQISEDEIDLLENYVLAAGIRGKKKWEARFIYTTHEVTEEDLEALNELRIRVMEPFLELTGCNFVKKVLPYGMHDSTLSVYCVLTDRAAVKIPGESV